MARILLIEDDVQINQLLVESLSKQGYQVVSAFSGTEGRMILAQETFDLILLDLMLPGLSGEDLLSEIRQTFAIPVIVISAKSSVDDKVKLLEHGADDYLVKPFDLKELAARIRVCLKRQYQNPALDEKVYQYQGLSYHPKTQLLTYQDQEIQLTPQERKLLVLFLKHPQKIFTKQELFTSAWEEDYYADDKTIHVHISNLRRRLLQQTGQEWIETVWGVGFRLLPTSL
ncbi:response regulator transcription factor [Ignavigranum ruoffiae]|uniref:response regulator transcription factor n=1 Tax=Ignavigranum ruoffiae TaxID=89093 RepID=UPI002068C621|nr:response regulator transcription factor [Ignavigranum ruoffiae]UPQ86454.1 response regulator transcription factor [Ignavigranum ruoffiae]